MQTVPTHNRAAYIAGLRALADALEANPAAPLPTDVYRCVTAVEDAAGVAEVDAVAHALGGKARWTGVHRDHREASVQFGPVTYRAFYCTHESMRRHAEVTSYRDNLSAVAS